MVKSKPTPLPIVLGDAQFLALLRERLSSGGKMVIVPHALKRMKERKISHAHGKSCLLKGVLSEPAHLSIHGSWKATIEYRIAGDALAVSAAIEDSIVVITVMNSGGWR
jgi:hypothetical protein